MREMAIKCRISKSLYDKRLKHIEAQTWEVIQYTYKFYRDLWNGAYLSLIKCLNECPDSLNNNYHMMRIFSMPEQIARQAAIREFVRVYRSYKSE